MVLFVSFVFLCFVRVLVCCCVLFIVVSVFFSCPEFVMTRCVFVVALLSWLCFRCIIILLAFWFLFVFNVCFWFVYVRMVCLVVLLFAFVVFVFGICMFCMLCLCVAFCVVLLCVS